MSLSRRKFSCLVLGAPVAAASGGALGALFGSESGAAASQEPGGASSTPEPTPLSRFLARQEEGLTREERRRVRRDVTLLEKALETIRAFELSNDDPPAVIFRAMRSGRR
ncbi:MAG: hypothetical protein ACE5JH_01150 [Acidobacteriota bacterium]